jgi:hypothetical protein
MKHSVSLFLTDINNKDEYTSHASLTRETNIFFDLTFTKLIRGHRNRQMTKPIF